MRRKKFIDKRLNWRDPDMPVFRIAKIDGKWQMHEFSSDQIQQYYKQKLENNSAIEPNWKEDSTYNLKKKLT
jgi:hypothetical protein